MGGLESHGEADDVVTGCATFRVHELFVQIVTQNYHSKVPY